MQHNYQFLPQEVIFHILSWLPAKSVGQCRCVCKQWRAMLTQPQFIKTHLNHSKLLPHYSLIFTQQDQRLYSMSLSNALHLFDKITILPKHPSFPDDSYGVHASCDGLILAGDEFDSYYLINPATQEIREVPCSPFALETDDVSTIAGFGYDSVSDDYKIVTISFYHDYRYGTFVDVFSFKNDTWKRAGSYPFVLDECLYSCAFVDGYLHTFAHGTTDYKKIIIVAFDLAQEKFCEVPSPPLSEENELVKLNYSLNVLGGCLCLYSSGFFHTPRNPLETDFWMMKEYGVQESWTMFRIIYPVPFRCLCLLGQDQLVLLKHMPESGAKLVVYTMADGTFEEVMFLPQEQKPFLYEAFTESLVSPHYGR